MAVARQNICLPVVNKHIFNVKNRGKRLKKVHFKHKCIALKFIFMATTEAYSRWHNLLLKMACDSH